MLNSINGGLPQRSTGYAKSSGKGGDVVGKKASGFSYSSDSVKLSYKSGGSEYQIEILKEEMKGFNLSSYSKNDNDIWKQQFGKANSEFSGFYQSVKKVEIKVVVTTEGAEGGEPFANLPEEWRPEAVAQRIFDFVTSFKGKTDAQGNDFFKLVKNAVLEGVKQALGELGEVDDQTKEVLNETTRLLNEKLDAWGKEEGILTDTDGIDITA